jgi:hypothetical protein
MTPGDDGCYCEVCGHFCDSKELLSTLGTGFNLTQNVVQVVQLHRDICRQELVLEQLFDAGVATEAELSKIRLLLRGAVHSMIEMFVKVKTRPNLPQEVLDKGTNGLVTWPEHWKDYRYNASNEPCDFLIGPCSCGAWHTADEMWVQEKLSQHQAVIVE